MDRYDRDTLYHIAGKCDAFEHVIHAMGYGYSLLNVSPENFIRSCDYCINWMDGTCRIFRNSL
ncbi:hypothetical protein [Acetonema longum]|uniref:Uncharacterized protein n=1 Tax=Acetonema longum DSM 6540 TaxID=1009370 RepID=F7NJP1_9FIRM|nr:hypothetical protein [Acetonema longum]EGO63745.1 hypothetical protein ALO_11494 [Acetonema longum DSM 6540]